MKLTDKLIALADKLDLLGFQKEANFVDALITKQARIEGNMLVFEDDNGEEHQLPTRNEVCPACDGEGKIENPAFEGGITGSEWANDWDEQGRDLYMSGAYDVKCPECKGNKVVRVPDLGAADPETKAKYEKYKSDEADFKREQEAERRMGA